jgi:hypothetical protein
MLRNLSALLPLLVAWTGVAALENQTSLNPSPATKGAADIEKANAAFGAWDKPATPGCALGVLKDGKMLYSHGYGLADVEYLPAACLDLFLPLYDPLVKLLGADRARKKLFDQASVRPNHRVLDIGCGSRTAVADPTN